MRARYARQFYEVKTFLMTSRLFALPPLGHRNLSGEKVITRRYLRGKSRELRAEN